jgi:hypothetical protein
MREKLRLFIAIAEAALMVTGACFVLVLATFKLAVTQNEEMILGVTIAAISAGLASWWIFRKLKEHNPGREALAAAIAVAVLTPVTLGIAMVLSPIFGGYAGAFSTDRLAFPGAVVGIVVIYTIANFALVAFVLCIMRIERNLD